MKTKIVKMVPVETEENIAISSLLPLYDKVRRRIKELTNKKNSIYASIRAQIEKEPGERYEDGKWEAFLQPSSYKELDPSYFVNSSFTRKQFLEMISLGVLSVNVDKLVFWIETTSKEVPTKLPVKKVPGPKSLQIKPKGGS